MLPDGFEWRPYTGGKPALFFGGRMLAYATETQSGIWSIGFVAKGTPHYKFMATGEGSRRYVEAWAVKWEAEIRALPVSSPFGHLAGSPDAVQTAEASKSDYARRHGSRRCWWKQA